MIIYSVNEGHYPTFKAASDARKKFRYGNYPVFRCGDFFAIRLYSSPKKENALEVAEKLQESSDVWVEERNPQKEVSAEA